MDKMLFVVFDTEAKAYEASRALQTLDDEGFIALHADGVVTRSHDGATTAVKLHQPLPEATMGGSAVGTLLGVFGGPVGLAVGAVTGLALGVATDVARARIEEGFAKDVEAALGPGQTALVAEIDEESNDNIDAHMQALGGVVHRRDLSTVANSQYDHDVAAIEAEIARLEARHAAHGAAAKARLRDRIESLKERLRHAHDRPGAS